jgi:uncharacterized membrane protein
MLRFLGVYLTFLVAHVIPAWPSVRRALVARLGSRGYLASYSLLSLVLFAWLIAEALRAPVVPLWNPGLVAWGLALVVVPAALALLGGGIVSPNPLSIAFVDRPYDPARPGAVAFTRHPILWGLALWGLGHLPANGHLVGLLMFGGLGAFALLGIAVVERRRKASLGEQWRALQPTARWPNDPATWIGAGLGALVALLLLTGLHQWLFQRDPLAWLR